MIFTCKVDDQKFALMKVRDERNSSPVLFLPHVAELAFQLSPRESEAKPWSHLSPLTPRRATLNSHVMAIFSGVGVDSSSTSSLSRLRQKQHSTQDFLKNTYRRSPLGPPPPRSPSSSSAPTGISKKKKWAKNKNKMPLTKDRNKRSSGTGGFHPFGGRMSRHLGSSVYQIIQSIQEKTQ